MGDTKMDKELFDRISRNSILAVFEAAAKYLAEEEKMECEEEDQEVIPVEDEEEKNWEGLPVLKGFNAFEEDPDEYVQGKEIGIPHNQLLVSSPIQGMLKPSPMFAQIFTISEED
jgi:hypothetical protein